MNWPGLGKHEIPEVRIAQITAAAGASSSRHPGLSNGVRRAFYNKGYRERCSSQVPKLVEIAAAAALRRSTAARTMCVDYDRAHYQQ